MGLLGKIASFFTGSDVKDVISSTGSVLDNLFTSDEEREEAKRLMKEIEQKPLQAQWDINKIEASHKNWFVAGWRPAIGWVCACSLASFYIPQFLIGSWLWVNACLEADKIVAYPLSADGLMSLVAALLGMGTLRTVEKFGKVTK